MAQSKTNNFGLRFAPESTLGTKATTGWRTLEPNNPSAFGATITTVERRPIAPDRGRKKGTVVNLESSVEYEGDMTVDAATDFMEGFVFAEFANKEFVFRSTGGIVPPPVAESPARDEVVKHLLHDREPVDAEIVRHEVARAHGARAVDHHRDRDALAPDPIDGIPGARSRERDGQGDRRRRQKQRR